LLTYTYIEYITPADISDTEDIAQYAWGIVDNGRKTTSELGSFEELVAWLASVDNPIVLVIPGEKVVVRCVPYNEKEKKHFAKLLPYELEEQIIDDVDTLHFVIGSKLKSDAGVQALVAYIDDEWFSEIWNLFSEQGFTIYRSVIDFQQLIVSENEAAIWFSQSRLLVHSSNGLGFSTEQKLAPIFLRAFIEQLNVDTQITVYHDDYTADEDIRSLLSAACPEIEFDMRDHTPALSVDNSGSLNFCHGAYVNKTPIGEQFKAFRLIAVLALIATITFVGVNLFAAFDLSQQNQEMKRKTEQAYRKVIPQGFVNDPVRQITRKLGQSASSIDEPSIVVFLLSKISPVIQTLEIELSGVNYSHKDQSMRINVQAESFNRLEKLRSDIVAQGLYAELLSSNAVDNKFQARLSVSKEKR